MKEKTVPDQSLADTDNLRREHSVVPVFVTLRCPMKKCEGSMVWTGRSYQDGMGPLVNVHRCDACEARQDIADDYYPRLEYKGAWTDRYLNLKTGKPR